MTIDQAIQILAAVTLFELMVTIGLGVTLAEIGGVARNWRLVSKAALASYVVFPAAAVGLLSSIFQAATQVQDAAIGLFPKFVAVTIAVALVGPWMGRQVLGFALRALGGH